MEVATVEKSLPNQGAVGSLVVVVMVVVMVMVMMVVVVVMMMVVVMVVEMVMVEMVVVVLGMVASSPPKLQGVAMGFPVVGVIQVVWVVD